MAGRNGLLYWCTVSLLVHCIYPRRDCTSCSCEYAVMPWRQCLGPLHVARNIALPLAGCQLMLHLHQCTLPQCRWLVLIFLASRPDTLADSVRIVTETRRSVRHLNIGANVYLTICRLRDHWTGQLDQWSTTCYVWSVGCSVVENLEILDRFAVYLWPLYDL